ncbi:fimbrial protein [Dryocola sp. BD626]|jgi:major type 1 subunit fimbrin (pilin)|uniref:fimbrial protein n=1 Tax=Dryocola sp. BD626 TaxID=3133273 RepID=UPI003F4FCDF1
MKVLLPLTIGATVFMSASALADSDNTITFKGEVTEQTCSVAVNGASARPVVLLPTVSKSELATATDTAGLTTFTLGVSGCTVDTDDLQIKTLFIGTNVTAAGNLGNTGTATGVELQLLTDETGTSVIDLRNPTAVAGITVKAGQTVGEHNYAVQYYTASGSAGAGTVIGAVQYAVSYL